MIYHSVNLRSDVYFFPSCSIAVFCTLSPLFVPFGDSGFRLLGVRLAVHVHFAFVVWAGGRLPVVGQP